MPLRVREAARRAKPDCNRSFGGSRTQANWTHVRLWKQRSRFGGDDTINLRCHATNTFKQELLTMAFADAQSFFKFTRSEAQFRMCKGEAGDQSFLPESQPVSNSDLQKPPIVVLSDFVLKH